MSRFFALCGLLLALGVCAPSSASAQSQSTATPGVPSKNADLKTRLERDLRARRKSEFAFIARVVELVDEGDLPRSVVNSTYLWARKSSQWPFQHFEQGIRIRAKKLGVRI